jgi:hypothetical protein
VGGRHAVVVGPLDDRNAGRPDVVEVERNRGGELMVRQDEPCGAIPPARIAAGERFKQQRVRIPNTAGWRSLAKRPDDQIIDLAA